MISSPWVTWVYSVDPSSVCHREYHDAAEANSSKISAQFQHCQANYRPDQSKILPQNIDNYRANLG